MPAPEFISALDQSGCIYVTLGTELASVAPNFFETVLDGVEGTRSVRGESRVRWRRFRTLTAS